MSCGGNSLPVCAGWTVLVQWFHLGTAGSLRLFTPEKFSKIKCFWQVRIHQSSRLALTTKIENNVAEETIHPENAFHLWQELAFIYGRRRDFFFPSVDDLISFVYLQGTFWHCGCLLYVPKKGRRWLVPETGRNQCS